MTEVERGCPGLACRGCRWPPCSLGVQGDANLAYGRRVAGGSGVRAGRGWLSLAPAGRTGNDTSWPEPCPKAPGQGHAPLTWALLGGFGLASALLSRPKGLFPHGGVNLAGGSREGVRPLQPELGSPAPCVGCTFPVAIHHALSFATPAPSRSPLPGFHPPQAPPGRISPRCRSPLPASCIVPLPHAAEMQGSAHRPHSAASSQTLPSPTRAGPKACGTPMPTTCPGHGTLPEAEQSQLLCSDASRTLALVFRYLGPDADVGVNPGSAGAGLTGEISALLSWSLCPPASIPTSWKFYSQLLS